MDKRSLLMIAVLSIAFFGVNLYFSHYNEDKAKAWTEQQQALQQQKKQDTLQDIEKRTLKPQEIPLVYVYDDEFETDAITSAIAIDDNLLAISWADETPKDLFSKKRGQENSLEQWKLRAGSKQGEPVIYTKIGSSPESQLTVAIPPNGGKFELQMLWPQKGHIPKIELAEYVNGNLVRLELNKEAAQTAQETGQAIVLFKTMKGYFPAGIYDAQSNLFTLIDQYPYLADSISKVKEAKAVKGAEKPKEQYYVLENDYQQLVFTTIGGALAEINLPFASSTNTVSVVREIEFDREMQSQHPYNDHFPANGYYVPADDSHDSPQFIPEGKLGGYYPLLRREMIFKNKPPLKIPPSKYALNIVSEYPEVAEMVYEVKAFDKHKIVFESNQPHRRITKTFSLPDDPAKAPYCINVSIKVEGESQGLWLTSGVPEAEWMVGASTPSLKYHMTRNKKGEVEVIDLPKDAVSVTSIVPDWVSNSNGFLGMILDPLVEINPGYRVSRVEGTIVPSRLVMIDHEYDRFKGEDLPGYIMALPLKSNGGTMDFRIFAGPFAEDILKTIDKTFSDPATGYNPMYIDSQSFQGWFAFISEPFAKFLLVIMKFFHSMTGSWALSIVLVTVVLRILMYPLNAWSAKSMLRMQQIAPEVAAIQERNKKDPKKAQLEIMKLYRESGANPMTGCLPLLIQMPFLIGMFDLLKSTFELRGAPFIPGWIDDLSAPDVLFSWHYHIFFIGSEFHLLPILLAVVMFIQQRTMSPLPANDAVLTDQQRQQRAMGNIMTVVFALMFYNFPSGLNIYWLSSMLLGMLQQWYTMRSMKPQTGKVVVIKDKR